MITPSTLPKLFTPGTRWRGGRRIALLAAVPLAGLVTLAAGCGTVSTPPPGGGSGHGQTATGSPAPSPTAVSGRPVPTTTGGPVTPGQPACAGWPSNAARGALPASFVPVAVIRCVTSDQMISGKGQWEVATLERADKNLAPLTAALRHPAPQRNPGALCPYVAMIPPQFVMVGGDGRMIIPRLPLSGCGLVQPRVLAALSALSWQPVSVRLVSQIQTQQEVASGCTPQYSDPFLSHGSLRPSHGGIGPNTRPASLRICVYTSGGMPGTARFVRAATVTGRAESDLLAGVSGALRASLCSLPHDKFAVLGGGGAPLIYVELGGCDRVLRYESGAGGLMGLSTGQATPGAVAAIESLTR
jgi:hypothetical protein